jgi:hypothetical protein
VLIIEDKVSFAMALAKKLEQAGHVVFAYAGVDRIEDNALTGIKPLTIAASHQVNLAEIDFCFLDHYFEGLMNGTSLTPVLVVNNIRVCGMSSVQSANESMQRRGAVFAFQKDTLGRMMGLHF